MPGQDKHSWREILDQAGRFEVRRVVKESGGSGVELKQAAESVATANGPALWTQRYVWRREEEKVALTLVVPFKMMIDVLVHRPA